MIRKPKIVWIEKKIRETRNITSIFFHYEPTAIEPRNPFLQHNFSPGQFFMIWIPKIDEIPISVSYFTPPDYWGVTIKAVGEATRALCDLKVGDQIGIRGPFGNGFQLTYNHSIFFGGGVGLAPLRPAILSQLGNKQKPIVINCALCGDDLLFHRELVKLEGENVIEYYYATEDGSCGCKGLGTDILIQVLKNLPLSSKIECINACGPERMLLSTLNIAEEFKIPNIQLSLERVMRCGMGLCGLCVLDPQGLRVCKDGPVFRGDVLRNCIDFGQKVREFSGRKRDI